MRKWILLILLVLPQIGFSQSQTERAQKQAKVIEKRTQSQPQYTPNPQRPNYNPQFQRRVYTPYYYNPYVWGYTPYWNPHRNWDGREYIISTNQPNTKPQTPPLRVSMGVIGEVTTQTPTLNPYLIIGGKHFLMLQLGFGGGNSYPYYDNIYLWEVEEWEDEYIGTNQKRREGSIAIGTTIQRFSPYIGIGFPSITKWDIYYDETYTLSSPRDLGYYSINKAIENRTNLKLGLIYGWDSFEALLQISSFEGLSFGDGLRLGLGIGIKL